MSRIFTRKGDDGTTGLLGGGRVAKSDDRIQALGALDEVNSFLGWAAVEAERSNRSPQHLRDQLHRVQHRLFDIGAELASSPDSKTYQSITGVDVDQLEAEIVEIEAKLPPLDHFILPGGSELAARLHIARTQIRTLERKLVDLHMSGNLPIRSEVLRYINRLGDWVFCQARLANHAHAIADVAYRRDA